VRQRISQKQRFEVFDRDGFKCRYCGQEAPNVILHVDHIEPVSRGGKNEFSNYATACSACNAGKGTKTLRPVEKKAAALPLPTDQSLDDLDIPLPKPTPVPATILLALELAHWDSIEDSMFGEEARLEDAFFDSDSQDAFADFLAPLESEEATHQ
jgi:hypothetical protein